MNPSDPNRVVRLMPLVVGGLGGTVLMVNRVLSVEVTPTQARSDALGIFMAAILILAGLLWQQIQPRSPEAVELVGSVGMEMDPSLPNQAQLELAWASHSVLTNSPAKTLVVYDQGKTLLRRGILGKASTVTPGAIAERVLKQHRPVYLVDLKLYPGRVEFDYLPENTQGVICQPLGTTGLLIVGTNTPRSFTQQDEAWIAAIADKLDQTLHSATSSPATPSGVA
ncbi:cofactor assembly of complex C subunit B [Lyngbya confervoides]|uniref:Cofactor assembly of complex C subunit B n=1 Tax=Lyngbya confervoides BDU141951 TaxID=1574623 RepID=A0ABD4T6P3_9CYAN|nr:cofactor assembly of complex C subunit B [Lyngbya confervoides]MCM1984316.1 cofactor assembly of complex C subunit B [Lyngbya confervoides BDU141951]